MALPVPAGRPLVLFTDLDGTLLDHHTYAPDAAREALRRLEECHVPVVFCSSKTFAEQRYLQGQLGLVQPFILENGSAAAVPDGYFAEAVLKKHGCSGPVDGYFLFRFAHAGANAIRRVLADFKTIKGFSAVSDADLEAVTGLHGEALGRARERWFTETLITPLTTATARAIAEKLNASGFSLSRGGRFYTVQSAQADKGKAVRWLSGIYRDVLDGDPLFAAVGDSANDTPMLQAVDLPFLVRKFDGTFSGLKLPGLRKIKKTGPDGFSAMVGMLLGG